MKPADRLRAGAAGLAVVIGLSACGAPPPDAATLLRQSSQRMLSLKGFHFQMTVTGYSSTAVPVKNASGDARPPDLSASANLKEGGLLLGIQVVYAGGGTYLKAFTGGWQRLTGQQLAQFFDPSSLFDPKAGLFAVMPKTQSPSRGGVESVSGHDTYPVDGTIASATIHQLFQPVLAQGTDHVTYWIESDNSDLWRARVTGNLFDASRSSTVSFDFSNHDQTVSITPPPLG